MGNREEEKAEKAEAAVDAGNEKSGKDGRWIEDGCKRRRRKKGTSEKGEVKSEKWEKGSKP